MAKPNKARKQKANESLENLLRRSEALKNGHEFKKLLDFAAKFKKYKPFNNMLTLPVNFETNKT